MRFISLIIWATKISLLWSFFIHNNLYNSSYIGVRFNAKNAKGFAKKTYNIIFNSICVRWDAQEGKTQPQGSKLSEIRPIEVDTPQTAKGDTFFSCGMSFDIINHFFMVPIVLYR